MSKSSFLKLYDDYEIQQLTVDVKKENVKMTSQNIKLDSALSMSHVHKNAVGQPNYNFTDFTTLVRGQDAFHKSVSDSLDINIASVEQRIATEGINYLAHKAAIEGSLATETARSIAAAIVLTDNKNNTSTARVAQKNMLGFYIGDEEDDMAADIVTYETTSQTLLQTMLSNASAADALIDTRINSLMSIGEVDAVKLMDVVNDYQSADTVQISEISQLQSEYDALKLRIDNVIAASA
jgi:hypothetical protein